MNNKALVHKYCSNMECEDCILHNLNCCNFVHTDETYHDRLVLYRKYPESKRFLEQHLNKEEMAYYRKLFPQFAKFI